MCVCVCGGGVFVFLLTLYLVYMFHKIKCISFRFQSYSIYPVQFLICEAFYIIKRQLSTAIDCMI